MLDEKYISLTLSNLKTIYNRTCKESDRINRAIEHNYHQADRVWENVNANEAYERIMSQTAQLEGDKEHLDSFKERILSLIEFCSHNTPKL